MSSGAASVCMTVRFDAAGPSFLARKRGHQCRSIHYALKDTPATLDECAELCRGTDLGYDGGKCNYFTFGSGSKQGDCQWETTFSAECKGFGWQADAADFYHVQYRSRLPSSMLLRLANQMKNREIQNEDNVIEIENKGSGGRDGKLTIKAGGILATRQINIPKLFGYADECTGARLGCQPVMILQRTFVD